MNERDWHDWLASCRAIVIKVGSAVITTGKGLNYPVLAALAAQIAQIRNALPGRHITLVTSGAVAAGRAAMAAQGRPVKPGSSQKAKQALAAIGQSRLMHAWNKAFSENAVIAAQVLLTRDDFHWRERFQHAVNAFSELLSWNTLPIVNENDTVAVHELKFGDNDYLASLIVNLVEADLFINLTSAPGVFAGNPQQQPDAHVLRRIKDIANLEIAAICGKKTESGTGGMHSKLLAARRVAQLGVPTLILPGREPDVLIKAFQPGSNLGTWIDPAQQAIPRRKFWLAYQSEPVGTIEIDSGAANALLQLGKSLLPGGISKIAGNFIKGDLIAIKHDGQVLGVGFSNYDSAQLLAIHGRKRHEIAAILGKADYPDAIHRDNLLLHAVI